MSPEPTPAPAEPATTQAKPEAASSNAPDDVIRNLLGPRDWADKEMLPHFPRELEIRALVREQRAATGLRATSTAYLLLLLKHEPAANRQRVLAALRRCVRKELFSLDCGSIVDYAAALLRLGDQTFLEPLLDIAPNSDGDMAEEVFSTLGEVLQRNPRLFLQALARRPEGQQRKLASQAGTMDGGGMDDDMLRDVRKKLRRLAARPGDPLAQVARRCLIQVEAANRRARSN